VFLVCTPEITSLHLAREKLQYLQSLDLGARVCLLVNRAQKRSVINASQIEQLLRIPVQQTFPNDYNGVQRALQNGKAVDPTSDLGKQFEILAKTILAAKKPTEEAKEPKKKLAEYFSILPGRFSIFPESKKTAS
jgi:Flp pilus assembly CpaE family ATPase